MPSAEPGDVNVALAVQVKDEEKAKAGLDKLMTAEDGTAGDSDVAFRDGYALLTEKGKGADLSAALDKGTLAANTTYAADMKALGEQGVLSGWTDAAEAGKPARAKSGQSPARPPSRTSSTRRDAWRSPCASTPPIWSWRGMAAAPGPPR